MKVNCLIFLVHNLILESWLMFVPILNFTLIMTFELTVLLLIYKFAQNIINLSVLVEKSVYLMSKKSNLIDIRINLLLVFLGIGI